MGPIVKKPSSPPRQQQQQSRLERPRKARMKDHHLGEEIAIFTLGSSSFSLLVLFVHLLTSLPAKALSRTR